MKKLFIFFLFCIICSCSFIYASNLEGFTSSSSKEHVRFMTPDELRDLIETDEDKYISSMGKNDLAIRNVQTGNEYKQLVKNSFCEIDENLKKILTRSCLKVDETLSLKPNMLGIDLDKMSKLNWNIGCTSDEKYENGFPHTRNEVIILPLKIIAKRDDENTLCRLLLHEKVHIYQKVYKKEVEEELVSNQRFKVVGTRENDPANPDINGTKYSHSDMGLFYATYQNNPKSFSDIKYAKDSSSFEHPFEWVAYEIEKLL
jgi:hypothetical protein